MSSRYGYLCFFLLGIILLLAFKNYATWFHPLAGVAKKEAAKKPETRTESLPAGGPKEASRESILEIAEKNIFNPDRKEFPLLSVEQGKPVVRPQVILYGVMITDHYQTASLVNPGRPLHKGEREIKTFKLGDQIDDYKLTRILPDRITLETKGDSFEVLLFDPRFPKRRTEMKTPRAAELTSPLPPPVPVPRVPAAPQPTGESGLVTPVPRPVTPALVPDPGIWRGRRPLRPGAPSENGGR
jgi:hypothetical protein